MIVIPTRLRDCYIIKPKLFSDNRGYFTESFNQAEFQKKTGHQGFFLQDNESFSTYGVLRGLHGQAGENAQTKLVRVVQGEVLDIAVDMREDSPTYLQHHAEILNDVNKKQLFIPRGFLHGFVVLSPTAIFHYKCDNFYHAESEWGIRYDDPSLKIDWILPQAHLTISTKDRALPYLDI